MSSPNGGTPSGGVSGSGGMAAHAAKTQAQWKSSITGQVSTNFLSTIAFGSAARGAVNAIPELTDGQSELENRTDLLDTGYLNLIQSKNWTCPRGGSAKKLPFDVKVGPAKYAIPYNGGARLQKKGAWRADAELCWEKTVTASGVPLQMWTASVIAVHRISDNSLYTRKHYYHTNIGIADPMSTFWSHSFVVPTDDAYAVSVWVGYASESSLTLANRDLYGGIQYTQLALTQLSHGTEDIQPDETVTNGGTLS